MGAIHRDIKPSNILFDQDGSLKIADFGLVHMAGEQWVQSQVQLTVARSMAQADDADVTRLDGVGRMANGGSEGTSTQALLGTFEFMSPEQKRGGAADERSDLYAVGLVAFRMLTGQDMPGFEMPSELVPGLNPAWDKWFKRALAQDVARRFESSAVMLDALPLTGAQVQKPPAIPDHPQVAAKPAEKRPELQSSGRKFIGAVVVVLLILGGVWLFNQGEPERFAESSNQADLTQPQVPSDAVANEVEARTVAKQPN
jgi:serine/threonine protein kinase